MYAVSRYGTSIDINMMFETNSRCNQTKVVIYGCAEQAPKIVSRINKLTNKHIEIIGYLDTNKTKWGQKFFGKDVLGGMEQVSKYKNEANFFNCVTHTTEDRKLISFGITEQGGTLDNLIDPGIDLEYVELGNGLYIQEDCFLQAGVKVGDNVSIHLGTKVAHGVKIGKDSMLTFACNIDAREIGEGVAVYTGANVICNKIGSYSVIGAGSVVLKDVPDWSLVVGNPAKVIKKLTKGHGIH